jgi:hypothetical protein
LDADFAGAGTGHNFSLALLGCQLMAKLVEKNTTGGVQLENVLA